MIGVFVMCVPYGVCGVCMVRAVCLSKVCVLWVLCECGEWCLSEKCAENIACGVCGEPSVSLCKVCAQ